MQQTRFSKVKNSLLELEKDFVVLKDREVNRSRRATFKTNYCIYRWYGQFWTTRNKEDLLETLGTTC